MEDWSFAGFIQRNPVAARKIVARFYSNIDSTGDCWLWTAASSGSGYGVMRINNRLEYAHRISFVVSFGSIPTNLLVLHTCDNPKCVRPTHLFAGSHNANMADKVRKGRQARGTSLKRPGLQKLSVDDVLYIRERLAKGESQRMLAKAFGISNSHVSRIHNREQWHCT